MPPDNSNNPPEAPTETPPPEVKPLRPDSSFNTQQERRWHRKRLLSRISLFLILVLLAGGIYTYANRNDLAKLGRRDKDSAISRSAPSEAIVSLTPTGIIPATVSIRQGGNVTWTNTDTADNSLDFIGHEDFNSEVLKPNDSFNLTFDEPGIYNYSGTANKTFTGTVIVE